MEGMEWRVGRDRTEPNMIVFGLAPTTCTVRTR